MLGLLFPVVSIAWKRENKIQKVNNEIDFILVDYFLFG
jgi:hypothetical protein